jgi:hypothetical protein
MTRIYPPLLTLLRQGLHDIFPPPPIRQRPVRMVQVCVGLSLETVYLCPGLIVRDNNKSSQPLYSLFMTSSFAITLLSYMNQPQTTTTINLLTALEAITTFTWAVSLSQRVGVGCLSCQEGAEGYGIFRTSPWNVTEPWLAIFPFFLSLTRLLFHVALWIIT